MKIKPIFHSGGLELAERNVNLRCDGIMINGVGEIFTRLSQLFIQGFPIRSIERRHFANMPNLKQLGLSEVEVYAEDAFDELPGLERLELHWTDDLNSKKMFRRSRLKELILTGSSSDFVAGLIFPHLEVLKLISSKIQKLERRSLVNLPKIREITFENSEIKFIEEDSFQDCTTLQSLFIRFPNTKNLNEKTFWNLKKLKKLSLTGELSSIPSQIFRDLTELQELYLYISPVFFPEKLFDNLINLKSLKLHRSPNASLHENALKSLVNLKEINLAYGSLKTIESSLFEKNLNIEEIDLGWNDLNIIEVDFTRFAKLRKLDLRGNVCVRELFTKESGYTSVSLQEIQNIINSNCTRSIQSRP